MARYYSWNCNGPSPICRCAPAGPRRGWSRRGAELGTAAGRRRIHPQWPAAAAAAPGFGPPAPAAAFRRRLLSGAAAYGV